MRRLVLRVTIETILRIVYFVCLMLIYAAIAEKSGVSLCRKSKMAAVKTEAAITFERLEITTRFKLPPPRQARLGYDTVDIARHFPTLADYRIQNGGHGNRKRK